MRHVPIDSVVLPVRRGCPRPAALNRGAARLAGCVRPWPAVERGAGAVRGPKGRASCTRCSWSWSTFAWPYFDPAGWSCSYLRPLRLNRYATPIEVLPVLPVDPPAVGGGGRWEALACCALPNFVRGANLAKLPATGARTQPRPADLVPWPGWSLRPARRPAGGAMESLVGPAGSSARTSTRRAAMSGCSTASRSCTRSSSTAPAPPTPTPPWWPFGRRRRSRRRRRAGDPAGVIYDNLPGCLRPTAAAGALRCERSGGRDDDVLDLGHVAAGGGRGGPSGVSPRWWASMYAAYQSHQSAGGATASNEPWCSDVSCRRSASAATSMVTPAPGAAL